MAVTQGDCTVTLPTHAANDIILLLIESSTGTTAAAPSGGWVEVADSPQDDGSDSRLTVFWLRAAGSSETNPTVTDTGNHTFGLAISIQGAITTGNPWDVTSGGAYTGGAGVSLGGDVTTVDETLVVVIASSGRPAAAAQFSNWANANLTGVGEIFDTVNNTGSGGGFGVARGTKTTAGDYGATTVDTATAHTGGYITLAIKPPAAAGGASRPTGTGSITMAHRMGFNRPPNLARR